MYLYIIISIGILIVLLYFNSKKVKEGIAIKVNEKEQPEEDKAILKEKL